MSHSILRVARVKGASNTNGIQRHNQRENKNYNNKDINHEETYKNYDLINSGNIDYKQEIAQNIDTNYSGDRKIRSDAIRHVDGLITSDKAFFDGLNEIETKRFFEDSLEFLEDEYGKDNMLYATVHLDERVPHMHFGFVPLTEDGRLSAKERLGNKKDLTELQDRFNVFVNEKGYALERGTSKQVTGREHTAMDRYKKDTVFHQQELEVVKTELQTVNEQLQSEVERIRSVGTFEYEDERKGLFSGREETGRKILSAAEFERLQQTIGAAEEIVEDYARVKNTDYYKENERLEDLVVTWKGLYEDKRDESEEMEKENNELKRSLRLSKEFEKSSVGLYHLARKTFPGFEKGYDRLKEELLKDSKHERIGRFMEVVQDNVYVVDRKREKQRRDDLER